MFYSERLQRFFAEHDALVRLGTVSPLSGIEMETLKVYDEWVTRDEKETEGRKEGHEVLT